MKRKMLERMQRVVMNENLDRSLSRKEVRGVLNGIQDSFNRFCVAGRRCPCRFDGPAGF